MKDSDKTKVTENLDMSRRSDQAMVITAVRRGFDVPEEVFTLAPQKIWDFLKEMEPGSQAWDNAWKRIEFMAKHNVQLAEMVAKAKRLDEGKPTEIVYDVRIPGPIQLDDDSD